MEQETMALFATSWLTRDQLRGLTRDQLRGLTRDQLRGLKLRGPTRDQLSWPTRDQLIPRVDNLYSRILDGIENESRTLDQSTFGPDKAPACKTPMCIAGHTVNLAGEQGYKLKSVFGFEGAARLIHTASCESAPPRYDSYPNEWALAYIKARAQEEKESVK